MNIGRLFDGRLYRNGCEFIGSEKEYQLNLPKEDAMKVAAIADEAHLLFDRICFTKWRADGSLRCFFTEKDGVIEDVNEETLRQQMRETKDWKKGIEQGFIIDEEYKDPIRVETYADSLKRAKEAIAQAKADENKRRRAWRKERRLQRKILDSIENK